MRATHVQTIYPPATKNVPAQGRIILVCATPYGLPGALLAVRHDLIASAQAGQAMAETLAPVLTTAVLNMGMIENQRQAKAG